MKTYVTETEPRVWLLDMNVGTVDITRRVGWGRGWDKIDLSVSAVHERRLAEAIDADEAEIDLEVRP